MLYDCIITLFEYVRLYDYCNLSLKVDHSSGDLLNNTVGLTPPVHRFHVRVYRSQYSNYVFIYFYFSFIFGSSSNFHLGSKHKSLS